MEQTTGDPAGRWRPLVWTLGILATLSVAVASSGIAYFWFSIVTCHSFDDTGGGGLEHNSLQGKICGYGYEPTWLPWLTVLIPLAGLLAVALVVHAWRRHDSVGRVLSVVGLVALPFLAAVLLSLPPNA